MRTLSFRLRGRVATSVAIACSALAPLSACSGESATIPDAAVPPDATSLADVTSLPDAEDLPDADATTLAETAPPGDDAGPEAGDANAADAEPDAPLDSGSDAGDAAVARDAAPDAGPLGGTTNPAASCKALHLALPGLPSGMYWIDPSLNPAPALDGGADAGGPAGSLGAFQTYCDMVTQGGGWTKVTTANSPAAVDRLKGASGRELLKCADTTAAASGSIISPAFMLAWEWNGPTFHEVKGTWSVNGAAQTCGNDPEYTNAPCSTWYGVGCGDGPGGNNKLFPGVLDAPAQQFCADSVSAHTNGAFSVCGTNNFRSYSVFVRAE